MTAINGKFFQAASLLPDSGVSHPIVGEQLAPDTFDPTTFVFTEYPGEWVAPVGDTSNILTAPIEGEADCGIATVFTTGEVITVYPE